MFKTLTTLYYYSMKKIYLKVLRFVLDTILYKSSSKMIQNDINSELFLGIAKNMSIMIHILCFYEF